MWVFETFLVKNKTFVFSIVKQICIIAKQICIKNNFSTKLNNPLFGL